MPGPTEREREQEGGGRVIQLLNELAIESESSSIHKTWHVEHGTAMCLRSPTQALPDLAASLRSHKDASAPAARRRKTPVASAPADLFAGGRWYLSCVVQHDAGALGKLLRALPLDGAPACLPVAAPGGAGRKKRRGQARNAGVHCAHAEALWVFFGQNCGGGGGPMRGRPEHTDDISHSGTWHMQLAGSKVWRVRPNPNAPWPAGADAAAAAALAGAADDRLEICCGAGDLLLLNTKVRRSPYGSRAASA